MYTDTKSTQPCGCDEGAKHQCEWHREVSVGGVQASVAERFVIKDSGERKQFDSGMVRDITEGKTDYSLALDGPMFDRYAIHLTKGAKKYSARNWMQAEGQAELDRFRESSLRHFLQWFRGEVDEDHAAAVFFNINGAEYVRERMK